MEDLFESGESDIEEPGPSKRAKCGAATYKTKFNSAWKETYPFISEVDKKPHFFYCQLCKREINYGNMGKHDVVRHINTNKHNELEDHKHG